MSHPAPKAPSSLVKVSRWSLLAAGIFYGYSRNKFLTKKEDARRAKEEEERPAKEAAMKAEKDKRDREELEYLARETGVDFGGGGGLKAKDSSEFQSDCGCKY